MEVNVIGKWKYVGTGMYRMCRRTILGKPCTVIKQWREICGGEVQ